MTKKESKLIQRAIAWERRWDATGSIPLGAKDPAHRLSLSVQAVMKERGLKGGNVK